MLLPAASVVVTLAWMVVSPSATRAVPGTSMLNAPSATCRCGRRRDGQGDGIAVLHIAADRAGDGDIVPASLH